MHAIGHDDFVGQSQPPRLHGMLGAKVHLFHLGVAVVGDRVAFRSLDAIAENFSLHLLIEGEG